MMRRIQCLGTVLWQDMLSNVAESRSYDEHVNEAVNWLFASQDATDSAGSAACYNLILGWEQPYPETSGYIVPTLYDVAEEYALPEAARRAERMAEWLLAVQLPSGAFPAGKYSSGDLEPSVFNTGQILRGLTRAYEETGDNKYKQSAEKAIEWLSKVQNNDGSWSVHDYNSLSHSYSSRISWPILEASHEFGFDSGTEIAKANLRWVLDQQTKDSWFKKCSFERGNDPVLHTLAYTIRGLLESATYFSDDLAIQCEKAAISAADKLLNEQDQNGTLRGAYDSKWNATTNSYCLTGNAQMALIWADLFQRYGDEKYRHGVLKTVQFLQRQQTDYGPPMIRGGLRGSAPVWGPYMYLRYPNWASKFFIDALLTAKKLEV